MNNTEWKLNALDKAFAEAKANPKLNLYQRVLKVLDDRRNDFMLLGPSESFDVFRKTVYPGVGRTTFMRAWKDAGLCKRTSNEAMIELPNDIFNE